MRISGNRQHYSTHESLVVHRLTERRCSQLYLIRTVEVSVTATWTRNARLGDLVRPGEAPRKSAPGRSHRITLDKTRNRVGDFVFRDGTERIRPSPVCSRRLEGLKYCGRACATFGIGKVLGSVRRWLILKFQRMKLRELYGVTQTGITRPDRVPAVPGCSLFGSKVLA